MFVILTIQVVHTLIFYLKTIINYKAIVQCWIHCTVLDYSILASHVTYWPTQKWYLSEDRFYLKLKIQNTLYNNNIIKYLLIST